MKRGLYKTEAIVLNSLDYGESDRILAFYTVDYGKMSGIAKGARRSRRRFVGNLDPMSHIKLGFFHSERSDLVRVEDVTLIEGFSDLKPDIERLSLGYYLLELVSEMTREGQVMERVFDLLLGFLKMLNSGGAGYDSPELLRFFEIKLLSVLGYMPHLSGCVVCKGTDGETGLGERCFFSSEKGGVVCAGCAAKLGPGPGAATVARAPQGLMPVSLSTIKVLSAAARFDPEKLARLKPNRAFLKEGERLLDDFIKHQIGKELKTKRFMAKLKGAF